VDEVKNRAYIFAMRDIAAGKNCFGITTCMTTMIPRRAIAARRSVANDVFARVDGEVTAQGGQEEGAALKKSQSRGLRKA